jgi:SAM-dependent methyltransferase
MAEFDKRYYQRNYRNYAAQNPQKKLAFYRDMVERYAGPDLPRRIHDIGCAFGFFLASLDDTWIKYGSDLSDFAIGKARTACPHAQFHIADSTFVPSAADRFGVITCFDVLEHVADLDGTANSLKKQLAPGGIFIFVVPVYDGLCGPIIRLLDRDPTHVHTWPRNKWLEWATHHFEVAAWLGIVRYLMPGGYYLHRSTKIFRNHVPAILVVCKRMKLYSDELET